MSAENDLYTFENETYRKTYWHTCSHILAQAVKRLYPDVKLAIGPSIDEGFYYDMDSPFPFTPEIMEQIEGEMRKICKEKLKLERFELPRAEAVKFMEEKGEPYKVELINDLPEDAAISFYKQGEFTDLCAGPHLDSTGRVKGNAIKLTACNAAYWRGDSERETLQRIYGIAFPKKDELDAYLQRIEEAKKRDHRKLGKELGLFMLRDEGPGFPFFLPKGMTLKNTLLDYWRQVHKKYGYVEISTPIMLNRQLWERSGHWDHYKANMYTTVIDEVDFAVKPMNCPGGMLVYASEPHSYRDLPLRVGEIGLVHRHELSGALHGLFRVRCFNQDDAHVFMTREQMQDVIQETVRLFDEVYSTFGLSYTIELSTMPEDHIGTEEEWERNQDILKAAISDMGKDFVINEGDGAFYGPKLDFHLADSLGRTWQCGTIQLDSQLPERFELEYTGEDGQKHRPVMIHRVVLGSIERFIGVITEHFAGAFPVWLSPVQVKVLTVTDRADAYAAEAAAALDEQGFRVETDVRNEKIGKKIREATLEKVPYMLVVGDRDVEAKTVSVRTRAGEDLGAMSLEDFAAKLKAEVDAKTL
ncbi:threonine--tRNA ligase [uncultured Oscillibacter sp.]|uniref:threonine--tRNA ligase n=1 Tax=uncultured Oscillibacter sp. TaxID=876091 RepID=UPI00262C5BA9|nr:threonine--tRNA ligase [uncultured Oscillibacter sp.]